LDLIILFIFFGNFKLFKIFLKLDLVKLNILDNNLKIHYGEEHLKKVRERLNLIKLNISNNKFEISKNIYIFN